MPSLANDARRAAVLLYTDDVEAAYAQADVLLGRLLEHGVEVIDVLRVDDGHWHPVPEDGSPGTPYGLDTHPFTAQRVFEGQVVHRDREELADSLVGTDEEDAVEVALAATRFADLVAGSGAGAAHGFLRTEARWLQRRIRSRIDDPQAARPARRGTAAGARFAGADARRRVGGDHPRHLRHRTSTSGASWCAAARATCSRARPRCWRSLPGSTATVPSPGARSTGAWRSTRTTRWPTVSRRC